MNHARLAPVSNEPAYRVPWHFHRGNGRFALRNVGSEPLNGVTFTLYGSAVMPASAPSTLLPGDILELTIVGHDLSRDTLGIVRWFRPDGDEYAWRVSF